MKHKKIFLIALALIITLTLGAVSAADNATDNTGDAQDILTETPHETLKENVTEKQDLNVEIYYPTNIVKPDPNDGEPTVSIINLPMDYGSSVSVYIDNKFADADSYGYFEDDLNLRSYDYGIHNISIIFPETAKYNGMNHTGSFEVSKGYIEIDSEIKTSEGVRLWLLEGATGYLTVNVDGKLFKKVKVIAEEYDLSRAYVNLGDLSLGTHTVEAIYSGDAKNKKITKKATVNVTHDLPLEVETPLIYTLNGLMTNAYKSDANRISVSLPSDATEKPIVEVDGIAFKVSKIYETTYSVDTSLLKSGNHTVKVTYPGDEKYSPKSVEKTFETIYSICMISDTVSYNDSKISLDLPEDAQGNLSVYVDGTLFETVKIGNDTATIYLNGIKLGKHNVTAAYEGSDYEVKNITMKVRFIPKVIYPYEMTYGDNETMYVEINPDANLTVTATKDGKTFNLTFINGKAEIPLSDLKMLFYGEDDYDWNHIILDCKGDITYYDEYGIFVKPIPARLIGAKDITMYCGDSKTYQLTCWGDYGKTIKKGESITVKIGSKYYYPQANANGVVKLKINEAPGTYNIVSTYHGKSVKTKLTVKHVVNLKAVKVKKSAKKLTLQATLKNTKPIKNKQVTFKFNGKTYKAKTNSKGVAKVTIKSTVLKKLKVGKKVTYQATYLKDTVKKTVKVEK